MVGANRYANRATDSRAAGEASSGRLAACRQCRKPTGARKNKKFCSDHCRFAFHTEQKRQALAALAESRKKGVHAMQRAQKQRAIDRRIINLGKVPIAERRFLLAEAAAKFGLL